MKKTTWPGNWKVCCDVCNFWFPSGEMNKRWDGLVVCDKDFETRHEATLYNYKAHTSVPSFVRKETDEFKLVCDIIGTQCRADYAVAGCAAVGVAYLNLDLSDWRGAYPNMTVADGGVTEIM